MSVQLPPGYLYGEKVRSHKVANFALSERFYPPGFETPRHSHKHALFCFVIEGDYTETYGGRTRECKTSTLLFHPPEELHAEHFHDSGGHSFIIEIEPFWLDRLREHQALPTPSAGVKCGMTEILARRLYKEFMHLDVVSDLIIEGLMFELVGEAVRGCSVTEANHAPRWLIQARELLHEHFTESLKLDDMAHAVGVHPVHLAQTFHKSFGCTVGDYVRRLRIERACQALSSSQATIVDIALATGFCDQSHFTRTFKRVIGVTPSQYRSAISTTKA